MELLPYLFYNIKEVALAPNLFFGRAFMTIGLIAMTLSVILFVTLVTFVLPKWILKISYKVGGACDRGVKRCLFKGKHCMVYDSSKENKPIIKQYLLIQEDGYKALKCKVTPNVRYVDYDVVLYNRYNKPFKVINVKEDIVGMEMTRTTRLDDDTSYVKIIIKRVNRTDMKKKPVMRIKGSRIFLFSILAVLLTAVEAFAIRVCYSYSFGEVYRESFVSSTKGLIAIGAVALVTGLLGALLVVLRASKRARK